MSSAFLPPLPLTTHPTHPRLAAPRMRNPTLPRGRPRPTSAAWEDVLLTRPVEPAPEQRSLHLLSLSSTDSLAYATAQPVNTSRKPYATTSSALPLPYARSERAVLHDALSHLYGVSFPRLFGRPDLPAALLRVLGLSRAEAFKSGNLALGVVQVICGAAAHLDGVVVEEAPSTGFCMRGVLVMRVPNGSICGETVYKEVEVVVTPAFAVAVGNVAGVDVRVERALFDVASVMVEDMVRVYEGCGTVPVVEKPVEAVLVSEDGGRGEWVVPWQVSAGEVDELTDVVLQESLRRCGVGVTRGEGRIKLLRKFVELMDEVERRELGILLAARDGMYALAAELQAGRSSRGRILQEMKKAEEMGKWAEVVKLGMRMRNLESGIMDVTAEPGSYEKDLDRDEWYRPNR